MFIVYVICAIFYYYLLFHFTILSDNSGKKKYFVAENRNSQKSIKQESPLIPVIIPIAID